MISFGASDVGLKRLQNQDSYCIVEDAQHNMLAVVCDGIGGGKAGDVASHMASAHIKDRFQQKPSLDCDVDVKRWLSKIIQEANDIIFMQASKSMSQKGMGTTCVGVFYMNESTYIFNVGDSRIYGLYDDFICLTEDHSYVSDLVKAGEITEEEAKHHPNRNMLTNALGIWDTVKIDINKVSESYRYLLICSDGLHGYVSDEDISKTLVSNKDIRAKVYALVDLSKQAGGYDNVSVILLEREEYPHE